MRNFTVTGSRCQDEKTGQLVLTCARTTRVSQSFYIKYVLLFPAPLACEFPGKRRIPREESARLLNHGVLDQVEKSSMDTSVGGQLGVEGGGHGSSLLDSYGVVAFCGDYFYALSDVFDFRRSDEDHLDGRIAKQTFADGAVDLAAISVAADADVEGAEAGLLRILDFGCQKNRTGAGSESWLRVDEVFQLGESIFAEKFEEGAGLSAGDDEAIDGVKLLGFFDEDDFGAEFFETAAVGVEITLQGQDSYFHNGCWAWGVGSRPQDPGFDISGFLGGTTEDASTRQPLAASQVSFSDSPIPRAHHATLAGRAWSQTPPRDSHKMRGCQHEVVLKLFSC